MDIEITQTETCACGRDVIGVNGTCAQCVADGAAAFWALVDGKITVAGFMRRLRRNRKARK